MAGYQPPLDASEPAEAAGWIDTAFFAEQTAGDEALQRDILKLFIGQAQDCATTFGTDADVSDLLASLHRLQGSARAIGAVQLATEAAVVEAQLRCGTVAGIGSAAFTGLQNALAETCRFAATLLASFGSTASPNQLKVGKHHRPPVSRHVGVGAPSKHD